MAAFFLGLLCGVYLCGPEGVNGLFYGRAGVEPVNSRLDAKGATNLRVWGSSLFTVLHM